MSPHLFAFWPFANPLMLLWGLGAAAPILIHLWSKRRYQEMTWAAMEFLLAAVKKNARRIRLEQLILLLIRVAIMVMLALALADPVFSPLLNLGGGARSGQTHWVFVLDASYSMDQRREGESLFQRAQTLAARIVSESRQGDGFTLLLMGQPPTAVIAEPAFDAEDVANENRNPHAAARRRGPIRRVGRSRSDRSQGAGKTPEAFANPRLFFHRPWAQHLGRCFERRRATTSRRARRIGAT